MGRVPVSRGVHGIAPQQETLRSSPDSEQNVIPPSFLEQISISVAQETAGAVAQTEDALILIVRARHFQFADGGLMVPQPHVFRPVLRRDLDWHAGFQRHVHHFAVDALGMHVDLNAAPRAVSSLIKRSISRLRSRSASSSGTARTR